MKLLSWVLVADLGEGPVGPAPPPLTLGKKRKKSQRAKKLAGQAKKNWASPPPQGLDPPLNYQMI